MFMDMMNDEFADVNKKLDESKVRLDKISVMLSLALVLGCP